jgi:hypothetical protein
MKRAALEIDYIEPIFSWMKPTKLPVSGICKSVRSGKIDPDWIYAAHLAMAHWLQR